MIALQLSIGGETLPIKYRFSQQELEHAIKNVWFTDREKQVIDMVYIRGFNLYDVAAELDVTRVTISRDLAKIRKKIIENRESV